MGWWVAVIGRLLNKGLWRARYYITSSTSDIKPTMLMRVPIASKYTKCHAAVTRKKIANRERTSIVLPTTAAAGSGTFAHRHLHDVGAT
eukprot:COSAG01_NODE_4932_length_4605_cov_70.743351_3_plen_89_part_00